MDISVVFQTFKIKIYFPLKSKTPLILRSNVVYKYTCSSDTTSYYVGKTKRRMDNRIKEHKYTLSNSAIYSHLIQCNQCCDKYGPNQFKIINSGINDLEISIKEALLIKLMKPPLNSQLFNNGTSHILHAFT